MKENYILVIGVVGNEVELALKVQQAGSIKKIAETQWENDNHSTSEDILKNLDIFLKKNKIKISQLSKVETEIDEKQKYTLSRIIKTVAKTVNYCLRA
jgi:hypothetical protein